MRPSFKALAAGLVLLATGAAAADRPALPQFGVSIAVPPATDAPLTLMPSYRFPPNCMPIIGMRDTGMNPMLANLGSGAIPLAVLGDFTGSGEALGKAWQEGIEASVAVINGSGGVLGRQVSLFYYDTGSTMEGAAKAAREIIAANPVAVLGPVLRVTADASATTLAQFPVPQIVGTVGLDLVMLRSNTLARARTTPAQRMLALVENAREKRGIRRASVIYASSDYGELQRSLVAPALARRNVVIDTRRVAADPADMADAVGQIRLFRPDAIFVLLHEPDLVGFVRALRNGGVDKPVYIDGDLIGPATIAAMGETGNGLRAGVGLYAEAPIARAQDAAALLERRYGERASPTALAGFVAATMFKVAASSKCSLNPTDLTTALRGVKYDAATEPGLLQDFTVDRYGNMLRGDLLVEAISGKVRVIDIMPSLRALY